MTPYNLSLSPFSSLLGKNKRGILIYKWQSSLALTFRISLHREEDKCFLLYEQPIENLLRMFLNFLPLALGSLPRHGERAVENVDSWKFSAEARCLASSSGIFGGH